MTISAVRSSGASCQVVCTREMLVSFCSLDTGIPPEKVKDFGSKTPLKRPAQPEELAPAYVFLASDADSSYITGEIITLLGGETTAG